MKTIFVSIFIFVNLSFAQRAIKYNEYIDHKSESNLKDLTYSGGNLSECGKVKNFNYHLKTLNINSTIVKTPENLPFDILGNFGNNVSFGGFYESYAVFSFTPRLNIKPTDYLNIYADHYLNILIPLSRAKEVSNSILISSFSMIALDYVTDLLFRKNNWLADITEFVLKNFMLNLSLKPGLNNDTPSVESIIQFDNLYCSVNITF